VRGIVKSISIKRNRRHVRAGDAMKSGQSAELPPSGAMMRIGKAYATVI
jgi:hypothetical protein